MQNVMYLVFFLTFQCVSFIDAASWECNETNPEIKNAVFDKIEGCGIIKITCMKGFRMMTLARCDGSAWWYQKPSCIPDECLAEPNITNGDLNTEITSRNIDIEYNYTCRPRFRKNGFGGTLRCNASGEWVTDVLCEAQCPPEADIPNGDLNTNITARCEGSEYNYTCRPRFRKNGFGGTLRCNASGQWETDVLCEAQCPPQADIPNGDLNTSITSRCVGDEYNYTCRPNFVKNGNGGTLRCNASGEWVTDVPCEDCFIRNKTLDIMCIPRNEQTESDCRRECDRDPGCGVHFFRNTEPNCFLCPVPIVRIFDTADLSTCLMNCRQLQSCITLLRIGSGSFQQCVFFNNTCEALTSYNGISTGNNAITRAQQTFIEKNRCPSIL